MHHASQIVNGVHVNVFQRLDVKLNVTRYSQINHEHRAVPAPLDGALHRTQANQRQGAGGATDHGIKLMQTIGKIGQAHHFGTKFSGQLFAVGQGTVGNDDTFRVFGGKVGGAQVNHLAGTDK
ncbi:hypothetical protein GALL_489990 [mine drainage metagenome]|uniref:Uncharacterized protein n=1 Tax=mine drainage metagenome TaxID=410659 RepID=A0A1J5PVU1_9ZZZZ